MHVVIHEDNAGAFILAQKVPPQITPRSKCYAIKTHWFREAYIAQKIVLHKFPQLSKLKIFALSVFDWLLLSIFKRS